MADKPGKTYSSVLVKAVNGLDQVAVRLAALHRRTWCSFHKELYIFKKTLIIAFKVFFTLERRQLCQSS